MLKMHSIWILIRFALQVCTLGDIFGKAARMLLANGQVKQAGK
jgi:hypothetical protein